MRASPSAMLLAVAFALAPAAASAQNAESMIGGKNLQEWIDDIKSRDASVRERGILNVQRFGPDLARRAIPALIHVIQHDNDLSPKVNAIIAVGDIGTKDPVQARQIVDALLITLNSSQAIVQFQSAQTLGKLAENSERALPELKRSIDRLADAANRNVSWKNQQAYCFALARIAGDKEKGPDRRAILALAGALRDDTMEVRLEAVQGLLMLGTPPDLKDIATMQRIIESRLNPSNANADREPSKTVQVWLRLCLIRVNKAQFMNAKTIGDIAATLNAPELQPRLAAVNALGILESNAKDHVPELVKLLDSEHPELVYAVCVTLGRIGDPRAIPDLEKMNGHKEPLIRFAAKTAIADINGEKKPDPEKAAEKDPKDAKKAGG